MMYFSVLVKEYYVKFEYSQLSNCRVASRWQSFFINVLSLKKKAATVKRKAFFDSSQKCVKCTRDAHFKSAEGSALLKCPSTFP